MINDIITGISNALFDGFGERYDILNEESKQDLEEPCFFIACINPTQEQVLGRRYFRANSFCIHYFPESEKESGECMEVAEKMMECLEVITAGATPLRGINMNYKITDGILHFFVNYDCYAYKKKEGIYLEEMQAVMGAK